MIKKNDYFTKVDLLLELKKKGISDLDILNLIEETDRGLFVDNQLKKNLI